MNRLTFATAVALLGLLAACQVPLGKQVQTGSVTLTFATPSRTVGADWDTLIDSYFVTLTNRADSAIQVTGTVVGASSLVLTGVQVGQWDITVEGRASGITVAQGTSDDVSLPSAVAIPVTLFPLTTGTGSFAFTLRFAQPTDAITEVHGKLYSLAGAEVEPAFSYQEAEGEFTTDGGYQSVSFSRSSLPPGAYRLSISLQRAGGVPARYLSEAINISGGVTSDKWVSPDGEVHTSRTLEVGDFASNETELGSLTLDTTNLLDGGSTFSFASSTSAYPSLTAGDPTTSQSLSFTPGLAVPGQTIWYSLDSGQNWLGVLSGTTKSTTLVVGPNPLWIRVRAPDGVTVATYTFVIVKAVRASGVTLDQSAVTLTVGGTSPLAATVAPAAVTDPTVVWTSDNPAIATVNSSGTITAVSAGSTDIWVTTNDGGFTDTVSVTVQPAVVAVTGVTLDQTSATLVAGDTLELTETIEPSNATNTDVTWSSNDIAVATVVNGDVFAVGVGTTTITVTTDDLGFEDTFVVTVVPLVKAVTGVTLDQSSLTLAAGGSGILGAIVAPTDATNTSVNWKSDNEAVATVTAGTVFAVGAGTATITATTSNGGFEAYAQITVTGSATVVFSVPAYGVLGFPTAPITLDERDSLALSTIDASLKAGGTGWKAFVGGPLPSSWNPGTGVLTVDTSGLPPGQHFLDLLVTWNEVTYSGSMSFTVLSKGGL